VRTEDVEARVQVKARINTAYNNLIRRCDWCDKEATVGEMWVDDGFPEIGLGCSRKCIAALQSHTARRVAPGSVRPW
jgi:hypothetical protein